MNWMIFFLYLVTLVAFSSGVPEDNIDATFASPLGGNDTVVITKQHDSGYYDDGVPNTGLVILYVFIVLGVVGGILFCCNRVCRREGTRGYIMPFHNPFGNQIIVQTTSNVSQPAPPPPVNYHQFQNYPPQQPPGYFEAQPPMPPNYYPPQSSQGYAQNNPEVQPPKRY